MWLGLVRGAYGSSVCGVYSLDRRVYRVFRRLVYRLCVAPRGVLVRGRVALAFVITRHRSPPSHSPRGAATRNTNSQHTTDQDADQSYNINECTQHPDSTSHRLHLYGVKHAVRSALPFDSEARRTLQSRSKRFQPAHPSRHRSSPRRAPKTREGERERDLPRGVSLPSHPRTYLTAAEPSSARRAIRRTFGERRGWRPAWPRTSPLPPSRPAPPPIRPPPLAPRWPCIAYR